MDVEKFILENKEKYDIIDAFQELLSKATKESYPDIIKYVQQNKNLFFKDYDSGILFVWNIGTFCMYNWTNFEILLDILINFSTELKEKTKVTELDIIDILKTMIWTIYYLFSKKVISIESIMVASTTDHNFFVYFYPEIDQTDHIYSEKTKRIILSSSYSNTTLQNFFKKILNDQFEHKKNRDISYHPSNLHKTIREDDIDTFQSILSKNNYSINYEFEYSYYDRIYSSNKNMSLIQTAAIYGSIHIFKYLWMQNDIIINDFVLFCAISGGNYDIIHICEEKIESPKKIIYSINSHKNELTDYFIEKSDKLSKNLNSNDSLYKNLDIVSFSIAVTSANYHIIIPCLNQIVDLIKKDDELYLFSYANYDFDLFNLLYSYSNKKFDLFEGQIPLYLRWVYFGMTSVIKNTLFDQSAQNIFNIVNLFAVSNNKKIAEIILEMVYEYKDSKLKDAFVYFKENISPLCIHNFESFEKNLIQKLLNIINS